MDKRSNIVKAGDVIGVSVKNRMDENLGEITDIVLDKFTGQTCYVLLSFGGIMGIGEKVLAIPWKSLHHSESEDCFLLNRTKESLKLAPTFNKDFQPENADWGVVDVYYRDDIL